MDSSAFLPAGRTNTIADVPGLKVGNAVDLNAASGVSVVIPDEPAVAAVDVRGGGPGERETALLKPGTLVERVDALFLSGGSAFGLDAGGGVMQWLVGQRRGYRIADVRVPIVPGAILFDLLNGGHKPWSTPPSTGDSTVCGFKENGVPPYRRLGFDACANANSTPPQDAVPQGNVGAGFGAKSGTLKGGLGSASSILPSGVTVGCLAAINSRGNVADAATGVPLAMAMARPGDFPGVTTTGSARGIGGVGDSDGRQGRTNTTICIVATDAALSKAEAERVAMLAHDGLARSINPVHTLFDGDIVFALSTGKKILPDGQERPPALVALGNEVANCLARAVFRGVLFAESLNDLICYRENYGLGK